MNFNDFTQRLAQVDARGLGIELAALVACVALAWALCKWFGRDQPKDSIWFGERTFDGVLFPLLALVFTEVARRVVIDFQTVLVLRAGVSVFLSLAVIRLFARVLRAVFPASNLVRLIERTISWLAWIAAVLWIVGLLPPVLAELDEITLAFGKTRVSLQTIFQGVLSAGLVLVIALWIASTIEKRIPDIKTRYTLIRAGNGREAIVPNESLITSRVENLSLADRKFNITTTIVVGYESDVAQVQSVLCEAAKAQPRVMTDPAPVAFLMNFAPDGLEFTLNFWVADPDKGKDNLRSAINIAILEGLRGAGIDIPYPQRVVRVESLPAGAGVAPVPTDGPSP
jgi:small-conductance mechanosensitive channel